MALRGQRAHRFYLARTLDGDGECLGPLPVEVSCVPGAVRLLC
ncbi:hypothetical protein QLQ12_16065 [Actinoplanes sp. NEAU-A12]|uniref:Uncharacterized protein n=1 Tax=Actinoplanes sandaracinus TaxID=3045177 RepID=A0ABT6WK65_9ACTN|nr:hypothetical protein [Actinoplanes sandaracinus]MDI6100119.1 hypothetical protein [Actinoplanes sandaracinus]